jgi:hypothetical protein
VTPRIRGRIAHLLGAIVLAATMVPGLTASSRANAAVSSNASYMHPNTDTILSESATSGRLYNAPVGYPRTSA